MPFFRPTAELTGKRLSSHTIAAFMAAQGISSPSLISAQIPMPGRLLRFLLRDRAISYWTDPKNRWLRSTSEGDSYILTDAGLTKVRDRLSAKAAGQSVTTNSVLAELDVICGGLSGEPMVTFHEPTIEFPPTSGPNLYPDEISDRDMFFEGASTQIFVNCAERSAAAREACIRHYGCECTVCGFGFERTYGQLGRGFIHVHHVKPLAEIGKAYLVDPIADLRPVCPNCHAMLHAGSTILTIEQLKAMLRP